MCVASLQHVCTNIDDINNKVYFALLDAFEVFEKMCR